MAKQPQRPLNKCMSCGGSCGRNVQKLQETKHVVMNPKTGKKEVVIDRKTVVVWEKCPRCGGTGVA